MRNSCLVAGIREIRGSKPAGTCRLVKFPVGPPLTTLGLLQDKIRQLAYFLLNSVKHLNDNELPVAMPVAAQVRQRLARRIAGEISLSDSPGRIMRKWREMFHIPQIKLAETLGVSPSVISDYESGRRQSPGTKTIKRFVETIITLDELNGGQVVNAFQRMMGVEIPSNIILDISEFSHGVTIKEILESIRGQIIVGEELLNREVLGYLTVDTSEALDVLSSNGFLKLFEATEDRALILVNASTGRSPLVAMKGEIKPSLFVLHGVEQIDYLAIELAKREQVPLAISRMESVGGLLRRLHTLRKQTINEKR